jgi:acetyl esterase/lipase
MNVIHEKQKEWRGKGTGSPPSLLRSVAKNLWALATPADFRSIEPTVRDVVYGRSPRRGIPPLADVYIPTGPGCHPSVVLVHGGAFLIGSKTMKPARFLAQVLVKAGFAVCSVDYRMIVRGGRLPESLEDVTVAVGWWAAQTDQWNLDPARISMVGISAGATLTMLVAGGPQSKNIHRVASFFGAYDLAGLTGPIARLLPRLLVETTDREQWRRCSPSRAPGPTCPTLLIHGTADGLVPNQQAHDLAHRREEAGLPTQIAIYEGAPHGFLCSHSSARESAANTLIAFLNEETS